jgi:protein tyrosine phosphatase (PTP) superfamily phosphohydrolase (DUF442 family)
MNIKDIQDFLEISPNLFTAGQPMLDQLSGIREAGCQTVINLAQNNSLDALPGEEERIHELGLDYISIPVVWDQPRREDLQAFFIAMEKSRGRKVFVHCARNMRVSAFVFLYRVLRLKQDPAICRSDLEKIWQPNETWATFIADNLSAKTV